MSEPQKPKADPAVPRAAVFKALAMLRDHR
jgi:hypothetical protein